MSGLLLGDTVLEHIFMDNSHHTTASINLRIPDISSPTSASVSFNTLSQFINEI